MDEKQILEEATTQPAKHHLPGSGTEGYLHPDTAAPAFPAAQEAPSTEEVPTPWRPQHRGEKPRKPTGAG